MAEQPEAFAGATEPVVVPDSAEAAILPDPAEAAILPESAEIALLPALELDSAAAGAEKLASHRRRRVAAAVAGAVFIGAAAIAAAYGPTAYEILRQKDTTLNTPADAAGLHLDDSQQAAETADYLRTALAADLGLRNPLGAVYSDPAASSRSVIIVGGTGLLRSPEKDLARAFELFADGESRVTAIHDVDAGAFGGVMRCGALSGADGTLAVCGWADHGALAIAMFPGRTADNSALLLRELRSAIQHRD